MRTEKRCPRCKTTKPVEDFYRDSAYKDSLSVWCRPCKRECSAAHRKAHPHRTARQARSFHLRDKYNITVEQYDEMLAAQGGGCAICKTTTPGGRGGQSFHIDHDHDCCPSKVSCGSCVRGLLCHHCNVGLGNFRDSADLLTAGLAYLARNSKPTMIRERLN